MPTLTFTTGNDSYEVAIAGTFDLSFLAGDDTLTTRHAGATVTASMGDGKDAVSHRGGTATVTGGAGADRFEVYASGLTADGGADADLFNIRGGVGLILSGGLGNDRFNFYAASSGILLHGNDGDDDFFGYSKSIGGDIHGDAGKDYFLGFLGGVSLHGGVGNDIYRFDASNPATFIENPGEGTDSVQVARGATYVLSDNLENVSVSGFSGSTAANGTLIGNALNNAINAHDNADQVQGLDGNDRLFGKGGDDLVDGGNGNDFLDGGSGNDSIIGGEGTDTLNGRTGNDTMEGGAGDDTYYVDALSDAVLESSGGGNDTVRSSATYYSLPTFAEIGIVFGSAGVELDGNATANRLIGGGGADTMHGFDGDDIVQGAAGEDALYGEAGFDTLEGGSDNDHLYGGAGSDSLTGGAGADVFHLLAITDSTDEASDGILDYEQGVDVFDFSAIDANTALAGDQAFTNNWLGPNPNGLWIEDLGGGVFQISGDVDGDMVADLRISFYSSSGSFSPSDIAY